MSTDASCVYSLFNLFATWSNGGLNCGVHYEDFGRMVFELDLLTGIPPDRYAAYLREHLLRADQDKDGMLSINEFMIWFFSEVAAIIPISPHAGAWRGCAPLYNQFVYHTGLGAGQGSRKGATALQEGQLHRLYKDSGLLQARSGSARGSVTVACSRARSDRKTSQLEAGSKLQFARLLSSLFSMAATKSMSMDTVLYRVASCGGTPPRLSSDSEKPDPREVLNDVQACYLSGQDFSQDDSPGIEWHTREWYNKLRTVFHRFNMRLNSGWPAPKAPRPSWASFGTDIWEDEAQLQQQGAGMASRDQGQASVWDSGPPGCCCQYQTLTLMELQTWRKVCRDCPVIMDTAAHMGSSLTPQRIETAFMVACSIGGLCCSDGSAGIHDKPGNLDTRSPSSPRSMVPTHNKVGARPGALFGTPFNLSSASAACAERTITGNQSETEISSPQGQPWARNVLPQSSSPHSPRTTTSSQPLPPGSPRRPHSAALSPPPSGTTRDLPHRSPIPTLNFIQFLEALRLVAVYIVGSCGPAADGVSYLRWQHSSGSTGGTGRAVLNSCSWEYVLGKIIKGLNEEGPVAG